MDEDEILDKEDIEEGLERLTAPEREQIAPILANVDDQTRFRENIREVGHSIVQQIIHKMFPDRNVTIQDFRRSLFQKLCDQYNPEFASNVMHGQKKGEYKVRVEWLGIQDINSSDEAVKDKRNSGSWDDNFTPVRCPDCDCIVEGFDDGTVLQHYDENGDYCLYEGKGEVVEDINSSSGEEQ